LKGVITIVEKQTQNLHEEFNSQLQVTWHDDFLEATRWEFKMQQAAAELRTRSTGSGNAGISIDKMKPPTFHGSQS
jgi:hypothetical protein